MILKNGPDILLRTSDKPSYINDIDGVQEKLEIKLEQDLISLDYIELGIEEGQHKINVEDNLEQTIKYAYTIFEQLTTKGWCYIAEGKMVGDAEEIIFNNANN